MLNICPDMWVKYSKHLFNYSNILLLDMKKDIPIFCHNYERREQTPLLRNSRCTQICEGVKVKEKVKFNVL